MSKPVVLFVCQSNGGKSAMAAALMRSLGDEVEVHSAGTAPASELNAEAVASCRAVGADMTVDSPTALDPALQARADRIVVLGTNAKFPTAPGQKAPVERWIPAEPGDRGLAGAERMDALRDDIAARVKQLHDEVTGKAAPVRPAMAPAGGGCGCGAGGGGGCGGGGGNGGGCGCGGGAGHGHSHG